MKNDALAGLKRQGPGVFTATGELSLIRPEHIKLIKSDALTAPLRRSRICLHKSPADPVQEMIIAILHDSYIRPHRHMGKSESFHVIEGQVEIYFFTDEGRISSKICLGQNERDGFCHRLSSPVFHSPVAVGEVTVVHEIVTGPFSTDKESLAPFSPDYSDREEVSRYLAWLRSYGKQEC